jgi:hypothetical protein
MPTHGAYIAKNLQALSRELWQVAFFLLTSPALVFCVASYLPGTAPAAEGAEGEAAPAPKPLLDGPHSGLLPPTMPTPNPETYINRWARLCQ